MMECVCLGQRGLCCLQLEFTCVTEHTGRLHELTVHKQRSHNYLPAFCAGMTYYSPATELSLQLEGYRCVQY